ncbi:SRSF protein kinase 3-like [Diadema antillarum]|uniref:SRSF protein kinase 3-like n=1 Tax=Diadema antillarum TaxID=105358 RepID=UPI003A8887EF
MNELNSLHKLAAAARLPAVDRDRLRRTFSFKTLTTVKARMRAKMPSYPDLDLRTKLSHLAFKFRSGGVANNGIDTYPNSLSSDTASESMVESLSDSPSQSQLESECEQDSWLPDLSYCSQSSKAPVKIVDESEDEEEEEQREEGEEQGVYGSDDDEQEDPADYCKGGYHPVKIFDLFNGKYHVVRKLGWGHFSTVWLAWDLAGRRYVALKVVKSAEHYTETALDEIKLLKCVRDSDTNDINRERVVHLVDDFKVTGVNGTHVCMVFEVLGHNLLKPIIQSKYMGLPIKQVKSIIRQVLEGLEYLHTKCKIIHTDIKPENILLCVDDETIRRLASEAKEWMKGKAKPPVSSVSTAPTEKKPQEKMSKNKKRKMKKKQKKQLALLEKQQQQLQEMDQEKIRRLSETDPDGEAEGEEVEEEGESAQQNHSNNGNQTPSTSDDKMPQVLEEEEEGEGEEKHEGAEDGVRKEKAPKRTSKTSSSEEGRGDIPEAPSEGKTSSNGSQGHHRHGNEDETEYGDVFEDAPERIPSGSPTQVNEKGDGPGKGRDQELCNGYGEEEGGRRNGSREKKEKEKEKEQGMLDAIVGENGLNTPSDATDTPTKESIRNAANLERREDRDSDPNENTISENSSENRISDTVHNGNGRTVGRENGDVVDKAERRPSPETERGEKECAQTSKNEREDRLNCNETEPHSNGEVSGGGVAPTEEAAASKGPGVSSQSERTNSSSSSTQKTERTGDLADEEEVRQNCEARGEQADGATSGPETGESAGATASPGSNKDSETDHNIPSLPKSDEIRVKLADLGNACWTYHHFTEDIQTRQYRALEVLIGAGYGTPADIWSTACMAFELACGDYLFEPHSGENYSRDEDHIAHIMELIGHIPRHIALSGKYSRDYFNKKGELRNIQKLKPWSLYHVLTEKYEWPMESAEEFVEFLLPMLEFDPEKRATAEECLKNPWLYS